MDKRTHPPHTPLNRTNMLLRRGKGGEHGSLSINLYNEFEDNNTTRQYNNHNIILLQTELTPLVWLGRGFFSIFWTERPLFRPTAMSDIITIIYVFGVPSRHSHWNNALFPKPFSRDNHYFPRNKNFLFFCGSQYLLLIVLTETKIPIFLISHFSIFLFIDIFITNNLQ